MSSHPQFPTSSAQIEYLSSQLQQSCPNQSGTLIMEHNGNVLAASGDVKEYAERLARLVLTIMQDTNGLFVHSNTTNKQKEELARVVGQSTTTCYRNDNAGISFCALDFVSILTISLSCCFLILVTVSFKTYQYAITLTHDLVICVKSNLD